MAGRKRRPATFQRCQISRPRCPTDARVAFIGHRLALNGGGPAMKTIPSSEVTPESVYRSRRRFMVGIGALALSAAAAGCELARPAAPPAPTPPPDATKA